MDGIKGALAHLMSLKCPLWVLVDIIQRQRHVRFTPESGH